MICKCLCLYLYYWIDDMILILTRQGFSMFILYQDYLTTSDMIGVGYLSIPTSQQSIKPWHFAILSLGLNNLHTTNSYFTTPQFNLTLSESELATATLHKKLTKPVPKIILHKCNTVQTYKWHERVSISWGGNWIVVLSASNNLQ